MSLFSSLFARPDHTDSVRTALANGGVIVDVRGPHEFAGNHIPGAVNIPHDQIGRQLKQIGPTSRPVVVYCRSGARSSMAKGVLERNGYTNVIDVGGIGSFPRAALN